MPTWITNYSPVISIMGVARIFFRGGETLFQKNFVKIFKKFAKNFQKYSKIFLKISKKISKRFLYKNAKNWIFWTYFSKNLTNPTFNFCAFRRKTLFAWNFWENFPKNYKKCVQKIAKNGFLIIFIEKFNKPSIQFLRVWTKNTNPLEILRKFSKMLKRFLKKIAKNALFTLAPAGIFSGGEARSTKGGLVRGSPRGGFRGQSPRTPEKFSKNL